MDNTDTEVRSSALRTHTQSRITDREPQPDGHRWIEAKSAAPVLWRNGLGTTREMAVGVDRSGLTPFSWRISIADLTEQVNFSAHRGIRRWSAVVSENGAEFTVDGQLFLASTGTVIEYDGEANVSALATAGSAHILNFMVQDVDQSGLMRRVRVSAPTTFDDPVIAIFHLAGTANLTGHDLCPQDLFVLDGAPTTIVSEHADILELSVFHT